MARASSSRSVNFWRADWFYSLLLVLALTSLYLTTDLAGALERRFYDLASTSSARQPSAQIAVIAIDDQSVASLGSWPWSREIDARLVDLLTAAKAKAIVHTGFFTAPQSERGLGYIRKIREVLVSTSEPASVPSPSLEPLVAIIAEAETMLDADGQLAHSFKKAANVLLPSSLTLGPSRDPVGRPPLARLGKAAAGIGHLNAWPDADGVVRQIPLLVNDAGQVVPSLALLAAVKGRDMSVADIKQNAGDSVQVGDWRIPTDAAALVLPQFYKDRDGQPAFALDSFDAVLSGKLAASRYSGMIVVIGVTAAGMGSSLAVPGHAALSPPEAVAHITSSILSGHLITQPPWALWAMWGAVILVALYLLLALPRLTAGLAATLTLSLSIAMLGTEVALLAGGAVWLKMVLPAALLLTGHLGWLLKPIGSGTVAPRQAGEESAETNRMLGLALQGQGQLDLAFERFQRVPLGEAVMANLHSLARDFEGKQQFKAAASVYQHMARHNPDYKDLKTKLNQPPDRLTQGGLAVAPRMLGRYQVERELGKGAMGVVYLGRDPRIGRVVAIKTMALSEEFEGDELVDARERFFREAETAGRLQHQNIVTIFDAGEDDALAYISMEFLKGQDLAAFCQVGQLLAVPTVLSIGARVAEALAYAHRQRVVHRDIKPANIMYEPQSDTVKVTDFGIARITDSSRTKTGLVLGTPSFMSPEQLAGQRLDGRSDLYSLGVMLFQLLAGELPFRASSMAELMHKIANDKAPDIRLIRPELPQKLANLIALSLAKQPQVRYQDGDQFARALRAVLSELSGGLTPPARTEEAARSSVGSTPDRPAGKAIDLEL
jgi:CHASE2 domain-containing sensor protein